MRLRPVLVLSIALHGLVLIAPLGIHPRRNSAAAPKTLHVHLLAASLRLSGPDLHVAQSTAPARPIPPASSNAKRRVATPSLAVTRPVAEQLADRHKERQLPEPLSRASSNAPAGGGEEQTSPPAVATAASPEDFMAPLYGLAYLDNPEPKYPIAARHRGVEGRVVVRAKVAANGRVLEVGLEQTSGSTLLDGAALSAIKAWLFVPARRGNNPVEAYALVPVSFRLGG